MPLLLPPAPRQAGRARSASCVLFSCSCKNSFDLMTAESFAHFCIVVVHQAGPAPFVPDVGDYTHTHSPRTQSTRQYKPCPLETAAAREEGARRCCVLAAAGPIACGLCSHLKKATRSLPFANHAKQQHRNWIGAVCSEAPSYPVSYTHLTLPTILLV